MLPFASNLARGSSVVVGLLAAAFLLVASAPLKAQTPVVFGDTISDPGVYFLAGNQSGSGPGITIKSDDVLLLLSRFTLRGNGTSVGIDVEGHDNVTLYGGRVTDFAVGIKMVGCDDCTVKDLRVFRCEGDGVFLNDVDDSWFLRMRCDSNGQHGIEAVGSDDNRFISILSHDNDFDGIRLGFPVPPPLTDLGSQPSSNGNKVRLCWASYNNRDGIRVLDSDENELERNQCVNNHDAGIRLDTAFAVPVLVNHPGSQDNELESNWCVFNADGIIAGENSSSNLLTNNTALANFDHDMVDDASAPPCANTWFLNFFLTKRGSASGCIF